MKSLRTLFLLALVPALLLSQTRAGEKKGGFQPEMPGAEHKLLASMTGYWTATVKAYFGKEPDESTGAMKRKMIFDGRFLAEHYEGKMGGKKFEGIGLAGFDPLKKKYVFHWADSMSIRLFTTEGTYDKAKKTFTMFGEDIDPGTGKKMKVRETLELVSNDKQLFNMYKQLAKGKEMKVLEIVFTRETKKDPEPGATKEREPDGKKD